jgi:hypothetical protein
LVKSLHIQNYDTAASQVNLLASESGAGWNMNMVQVDVAAGAVFEWNGWFVLNPGDEILIYAAGTKVYGWASGAVLAGPNQFPPAR